MRRKLIKQANQAYTVTLPIEWIRDNNLKEKQEIELNAIQNKVIITPSQKTKSVKNVLTLNLKGKEFNLFRASLIEAYTLGYDKLIIHTDVKNAEKYLEELTSKYFLGFEVVQQDKNTYELENLSEPGEDQFHPLLRKTFMISVSTLREIINNIEKLNKNGKEILEKMEKMERYNNFCMRSIVKKIINIQAVPQTWLMLSYLTKYKRSMTYLIKYFTTNKIKLNKEWKEVLEELFENWSQLYERFYKDDIEEINNLYEKNKEFLNKKIFLLTPKNKNENVLYYHIIEIQRLISYSTAPIMSVIRGRKN